MSDAFARWMSDLESSHLANLKFSEVARALRALSSTYVERRHTALASHKALEGAGKRAAFALYYGPLHFLAVSRVLQQIGPQAGHDRVTGPKPRPADGVPTPLPVVDLGCGTGAAGAAAAAVIGAKTITGVDTHPWALDQARRTYAMFGLDATLVRGAAGRLRPPKHPSLIVAGYAVNELDPEQRTALQRTLLTARASGSDVFVMEPLARTAAPWWPDWTKPFEGPGTRLEEWKLEVDPPPLVRKLGDAAGLTATRVNVRTMLATGLGVRGSRTEL